MAFTVISIFVFSLMRWTENTNFFREFSLWCFYYHKQARNQESMLLFGDCHIFEIHDLNVNILAQKV